MGFGVQGHSPLFIQNNQIFIVFFCICVYRLTSVTGAPLTNARTISRVLIDDANRPHPFVNLLFMQFGQLLTHDVSHSSSIKTRMLHTIQFEWFFFSNHFNHVAFILQVMDRQFGAVRKMVGVFCHMKLYILLVCPYQLSLMTSSTVSLIKDA